MSDYLIAFGVLATTGLLLLAAPRGMKRAGWGHSARPLTHVLSGVLSAAMIWMVDDRTALLVVTAAAVPLLIAAVEFGLLGSMQAGSRWRDYGFAAYAAGLALSVAFFFPDRRSIITALLVLALADPAAAIVGRRFGRTHVEVLGARRTLEGSASFAVTAFAVTVVGLTGSGMGLGRLLGLAVFTALTCAAVELVVPSTLDNLLVPLWAGFLLHLHATVPDPRGVPYLAGLATAAVLGWGVHRAGWLDLPGAVAAFFTAACALTLGGPAWLLPALVFLATTSVLSKVKAAAGQARRGLEQTVVNGVVPVLPVLGFQLTGDWTWYAVHVAALSVACADTFASEIGRLAGRAPRSLRGLRRVEAGTSGAVTWPGSLGSLGGAAVVALPAAALAPAGERFTVLVVAMFIGPLGMLIDAALGAWLQARYTCATCKARTEQPQHCGVRAVPAAGVRGLTNERVNLAANAAGGLLALNALFLLP
ncbi:DUF92 domain-containing protein [Streptomyces sp. TRM70308]|uniref:DUF92 domain-containing protein n=1 Tax=Streptomyces sp. TRM70308 TaxID=3131932 RepID=UPI003CFCEC85